MAKEIPMTVEMQGEIPPPDSRPSRKQLPAWSRVTGLLLLVNIIASCGPAVTTQTPTPENQTVQAATWMAGTVKSSLTIPAVASSNTEPDFFGNIYPIGPDLLNTQALIAASYTANTANLNIPQPIPQNIFTGYSNADMFMYATTQDAIHVQRILEQAANEAGLTNYQGGSLSSSRHLSDTLKYQ